MDIGSDRLPRVCMVAYTDYVFDARIRREAETLASNGFKVMCLKLRNGEKPEHYMLNGVEIRELSVPKYQGKSPLAYLASYVRFLLTASAICVYLVIIGDLDVVHVHNLPDFLVGAAFLPRLFGRKVVLDVHDSVPETFATKFSGASIVWRMLCWEERLSAMVAHKVICVNHPQRDTLVGRGIPEGKTFISMNVPDPRIFKQIPNQCRTETGDTFNVVYHGTMVERLGVDLIIRAVALLRDRVPGLQLHLWGHGDDRSNFKRLAAELGMADRIHFTTEGFPVEELPERLKCMDLGVVGNRASVATALMLPVKLMEYVSLGIPVVAPRLKTIAHYFKDDMVTFYEPENVESFAEAIFALYSNRDRRCQQAERARDFLDEYGWERQGPLFVRFYRHLLGAESGD